MDSPEAAAQMLCATDEEEGIEFAKKLNHINDERKGVVASTVKEVRKRLGMRPVKSRMIVMGNPHWRPGVLGLVANSVAETEGVAVCLWGREGGDMLRGSCRSDGAVNVVELMSEARELFDDFGGHAFSGGFSMKEENVHTLSARLGEAYEKVRARAKPEEEVIIDRELHVEEATAETLRNIRRLAPFGEANLKPLFLFPKAAISRVRQFGKTANHLDMQLSNGNARVSGMSFFSTPESFTKRATDGTRADIVGHLEHDWRGNPRVRVVDII